jgi:hypothetical protein
VVGWSGSSLNPALRMTPRLFQKSQRLRNACATPPRGFSRLELSDVISGCRLVESVNQKASSVPEANRRRAGQHARSSVRVQRECKSLWYYCFRSTGAYHLCNRVSSRTSTGCSEVECGRAWHRSSPTTALCVKSDRYPTNQVRYRDGAVIRLWGFEILALAFGH